LVQCREDNKGYAKNNQRVREDNHFNQGYGDDKQAYGEGNQWFDETIQSRVGNKKPTQKNPPKKTQKNPPKKNPQKMFFFWVFLGF
jgi:hypothetical protein